MGQCDLISLLSIQSKPNGSTTVPKPEPISPQRRVVPYVSFPRQLSTQPHTSTPPPPHQNHESSTLDEMEAEETPLMSPPPNMKLEPKSPHKHKRLIPYVSVPARMSVHPANKRPANGDFAQGSPKLSMKRRKLGSGPLVKDEIEPSTPRPRRTPLIAVKVCEQALFNLFIQPDFSQHQLPTPTTTSKQPKKEVRSLEGMNIPGLTIIHFLDRKTKSSPSLVRSQTPTSNATNPSPSPHPPSPS